ncbi:Na/Pi symporter [Magnetospirillum aberrantis]|uniref:Na/Pi cotransporter family protein n=1 Tax=Magnetospirillum aberrantis SpK TaxID=908842 RepID=A0A7C9QU65_9PROT|nr:Na/Pi cotransporter family protein [Magnetospirillum aberrantis SpK]
METALLILAGLGFFFIGVKHLGSNLTHIAGPRLRKVVQRATANGFLAAVLGSLVGMLTQSTNAITFIVIGLVNSGTLAVRSALPVIAWANVGTSVLVFLATISIHDAILVMVVLTGFAYYRGVEGTPRWRHMVGALLGLALLFVGLEWVRDGSTSLRGSETLRDILLLAEHSPWLAFVLGALLTPLVQTAKTVSTITVALISAGLLGVDHAVLVVMGANFGSCVNVLFMSSNIRGRGRQLSIYQALLKVAGVAATLPLIVLWVVEGVSPEQLLAWFDVPPHVQVAIVYLVLQVAAIVVLAPIQGWVILWLDRLSPITVQEKLARPKFIFDGAWRAPETAATLVVREQHRQMSYLPGYLEPYREDSEVQDPLPAASLHSANALVMREIDDCLKRSLERAETARTVNELGNLQNRGTLIGQLQDDLLDFAKLLEAARERKVEHRMIGHLVEATHALVSLAAAAMGPECDFDTLDMLKRLTGDRPELMDRVRKSLAGGGNDTVEAQEMLFNATMLFKRIVWEMRQLLSLLDADGERSSEAAGK